MTGVDPGFLERGFICIKVGGGGVSLCRFYLIFLKYPMVCLSSSSTFKRSPEPIIPVTLCIDVNWLEIYQLLTPYGALKELCGFNLAVKAPL